MPEYGFIWPVFSLTKTKSYILLFYGRSRVIENPYSGIFYAVYNQNKFLEFDRDTLRINKWVLIHLFFHKKPVYKQLALKIYFVKQPLGLKEELTF